MQSLFNPNNKAGLFDGSFSWGKGGDGGSIWKLQKIDENWGNSMKFSGKMYLKIILKVSKNQGFTLSIKDTFFEKPQGGVILTVAVLGLKSCDFKTRVHLTH